MNNRRGCWKAVKEGNVKALELLIDQGFNYLERGPYGETLLHMAALHGRNALAEMIIENFPCLMYSIYKDPYFRGETALHIAIVNQMDGVVKLMLERKCDPNMLRVSGVFFTGGGETQVYYGETPLHFAGCVGTVETFKNLLTHGASIQDADIKGNTVFHFVAGQHEDPTKLNILSNIK